MSIEALWVVAFGDVEDGKDYPTNGGVAVFETNRVFGGDSAYAYVGTFRKSGTKLTGTATITRHNDDPDFIDVWLAGESPLSVSISALVNEDETVIEGKLSRDGEEVPIRFTRFAELPG